MIRKLNIVFASAAVATIILATAAFTGLSLHSKAQAEVVASSKPALMCYIGKQKYTSGVGIRSNWICTPEAAPAMIN